jgi:hypothetical protein
MRLAVEVERIVIDPSPKRIVLGGVIGTGARGDSE